MTHPLANYSFLPWLRQGLANRIQSADVDPAVLVRPSVSIDVDIVGEEVGGATATETITRSVALYGPGDLVGIDSRAIVRTEPRNWITNFEPNYLAAIEFYDEDFPWRYTPAAPDTAKGRLRPWIMLVVLAEGEFSEAKNMTGKPLPYVDVPDFSVLPAADQLWAWAHVHVNRSLAKDDDEIVSSDMAAVLPKLQATLAENPDLAYSRIVCPRKLAENTAYHAFVIPVFETGRLAGLGLDPAQSPHATFSAWDANYPAGARPDPQSIPVYHRWFFRTGAAGDFESLVRLLQPKPVDKRVGTRNMDVQNPGSNMPAAVQGPPLGGILKLGGALRVPRERYTQAELAVIDAYEYWDQPYPRQFQQKLSAFISLADEYAKADAPSSNAGSGIDNVTSDPDPLITPPLYGTWHALSKRLLVDENGQPLAPNDNWVHDLNLDPRHRVAAGFGTRVVQEGQEKLMDAAWGQIGSVLEANERIRRGQLAKAVSLSIYERHFQTVLHTDVQKSLLLTAPLSARVMASDHTVLRSLRQSRLQTTMVSSGLRRTVRPRARLLRMTPFSATYHAGALLERVNRGEVFAAPPKIKPPAIESMDELSGTVMPKGVPPALVRLLRKHRWLRWLPLLLALLFALLALLLGAGVGAGVGAVLVATGIFVTRQLTRLSDAIDASEAVGEAGHVPSSVDAIGPNSTFHLTEPGSSAPARRGGADSVEAARFKLALKGSYATIAASAQLGVAPVRVQLDLTHIATRLVDSIDPRVLIPKRVMAGIHIPKRIIDALREQFIEAMAYPVIETPMYEPLKDISAELFLPNINLIEQNSITLLETNQAFIEAYMVGLNHEFARELLWREYPTDQRGTPFRQFWDVRSYLTDTDDDEEALKEKLRDIPPLHRWPKASKLGDHDHREEGGNKEEEVVLVIRGELLKRYPNAVVYAHRACWQRKGNTDPDVHPCSGTGDIDNTKERRLAPLTDAEEAKPPRSKVRTPLYEAKVDPDIYFFGFDLTAEAAKGESGENPDDDPGWFFVIKERPGEPRFGLDIEKQQINVWNDLSWGDVQPGAPGSYIEITGATPTIPLVAPTATDVQEKLPQYDDDKKVTWSKDMTAAELAYVLFQAPVLVAVHASEVLGQL